MKIVTNLVDYSPNSHLKASARREVSLVHHDVESSRVEFDSMRTKRGDN